MTSFAWHELPEGLNVADFDAVILDLRRLAEEEVHVPRHLPPAQDFARLVMRSRSVVIAVGDPNSRFTTRYEDERGNQHEFHIAATWWLPCDLPTVAANGEVIAILDEDVAFWFGEMKQYRWHFTGRPAVDLARSAKWQAVVSHATGLSVGWEPLAETRYGEALAVQLNVSVARGIRDRVNLPAEAGSPIVWLPPHEAVVGETGLALLLMNLLEVGIESKAPTWASDYQLPDDLAAADVVAQRGADLQAALEALRTAQGEAAEAAKFRKLLYEQGEEVLEPIAREALTLLGAEVEEPARRGIEDGRFRLPDGRQGMLEIKGRKGQLTLGDVRQLNGWMADALAAEEWSGKGVILANTQLDRPPHERNDFIASNALKFARNLGICVVPTPQLFQALHDLQAGRLDQTSFWDAVFGTAGVTSLPEAAPVPGNAE